MNKRGTHVGMIISFIIFITFIVFLYVVVQPIVGTGENKGATIEYLEFKIVENTSANFTSLSIDIDNNPGTNCIKLQNFFILLSEQIEGFNVIAKDENGIIQDTDHQNFSHLVIDRDDTSKEFFKIYSSPVFEGLENRGGCDIVLDEDYDIGLVKTANYVFKDRIIDLMAHYESHYEDLKKDFGIPVGDDFGFGFTESDGTETKVEQELKGENIYVEELPIQYIDSEANILSGFINVEVW